EYADPELLRHVVAAFRRGTRDYGWAYCITDALSRCGPSAASLVRQMLRDSDSRIRATAVGAISNVLPERAAEVIGGLRADAAADTIDYLLGRGREVSIAGQTMVSP